MNQKEIKIQKVIKKIENRCKDIIDSNKEILIACSGGIDSMVLLSILIRIGRSLNNLSLTILHVNYGLRGVDSDKDQAFVEEFARKNNVKCKVFVVKDNIKETRQNEGIQQWARNVRYDWFNQVQQELLKTNPNGSIVAVAHHGNDIAENVIFRMARGTGIGQLGSMKSDDKSLWRPLLHLTRQEIKEYATGQNIPNREDSTNATLKYSRNRVRHTVINELERLFPGASEKIACLANESSDIIEYLSTKLWEDFGGTIPDKLPGKWLRSLPFGVGVEAIAQYIKRKSKSHIQLSRSIIYTTLEKIWCNDAQTTDFVINIPDGGCIAVKSDYVCFCLDRPKPFQLRFSQHWKNIHSYEIGFKLEPGAAIEVYSEQRKRFELTNSAKTEKLYRFLPLKTNEKIIFKGEKKKWDIKQTIKKWKQNLYYEILIVDKDILGLFDGEHVVRPDKNGNKKIIGTLKEVLDFLS